MYICIAYREFNQKTKLTNDYIYKKTTNNNNKKTFNKSFETKGCASLIGILLNFDKFLAEDVLTLGNVSKCG